MQRVFDAIGRTKQATADLLNVIDDGREEILGHGVSRKTIGEATSRLKWLDTALARMESELFTALHKSK